MRIELTYAAWKAAVLPLNYTRSGVSEATRTLDPLIKSQLLCHLSYRDSSDIIKPEITRVSISRWWRGTVSNRRTRRDLIYSQTRLATSLPLHHGADYRNRTYNLLITNQLLCQLS